MQTSLNFFLITFIVFLAIGIPYLFYAHKKEIWPFKPKDDQLSLKIAIIILLAIVLTISIIITSIRAKIMIYRITNSLKSKIIGNYGSCAAQSAESPGYHPSYGMGKKSSVNNIMIGKYGPINFSD